MQVIPSINMKVGRNDPCICGSGKKFKKCYENQDTDCALRLQDKRKKNIAEHDKREKFVLRFFNDVLEETSVILLKSEEGNDRIPSRIQMIVSFSLIDMLGSYWYEYLGKTGKTNERAQDWYSTFCATEKNEYYKNLWKEITAERLYAFRNSLVHFFGLGEIVDDISVALAPNNLSDETHRKWENEFSKRGKKTIIVRAHDFYNLVRKGAILMLNEWRGTIKKAQTDREREREYIAGIERVWIKIQKEGAVRVLYNKQ